jgi:phage tail sheath protein FI
LLHAEWRAGRLLGQRPADACFVRCDRMTLTQADVANGQLVALAGVAILRPAEFTVLRIEQATMTSGRR